MARRKRQPRRSTEPRAAVVSERPVETATPSSVVLAGAVLGLVVLAAYLRTAATDITFGDAPELTAVAATLGVAHPPGYPLWTMLAHLFTLLPIGSLPFRVSAFSATAAAASVVVVYAVGYRLSRNVIAAIAAAALLALLPVFWMWSVVPEVFALNALLAGGLIALVIAWHTEQRPALLVAAGFVGGLGMANQQTIGLLAPAILFLMWRDGVFARQRALLARTALAFAAGILPYAYLPVAAATDPAWNWSDISSAGDLVGHVLRTAYGTGQLVSSSLLQGSSAVGRLGLFGMSFGLAEGILVVLGALVLFRRDRGIFWFLTIAFLLSGPAFIAYSNIRIDLPVTQAALERFFLLPHVVVVPLAAIGIVDGAARVRATVRVAEAAIAVAAVAAGIGVAVVSWGSIDHSDDQSARHYAEDILATARPGQILLASGDAAIMTIAYLRTIEKAGPDLTFIQAPLLTGDWYVRQLHRRHPDLVLTAARYDGGTGTMRDLVEPNGHERFDIAGGLLDDSLDRTYGLVRRGLIQELHPLGEALSADALAATNDRLLRSYRPPDPADAPGRGAGWDTLVLADYAFIPYDVAQAYERQRAYPQARDWYTRALAIDHDLVEAKAALARLPR